MRKIRFIFITAVIALTMIVFSGAPARTSNQPAPKQKVELTPADKNALLATVTRLNAEEQELLKIYVKGEIEKERYPNLSKVRDLALQMTSLLPPTCLPGYCWNNDLMQCEICIEKKTEKKK